MVAQTGENQLADIQTVEYNDPMYECLLTDELEFHDFMQYIEHRQLETGKTYGSGHFSGVDGRMESSVAGFHVVDWMDDTACACLGGAGMDSSQDSGWYEEETEP